MIELIIGLTIRFTTGSTLAPLNETGLIKCNFDPKWYSKEQTGDDDGNNGRRAGRHGLHGWLSGLSGRYAAFYFAK